MQPPKTLKKTIAIYLPNKVSVLGRLKDTLDLLIDLQTYYDLKSDSDLSSAINKSNLTIRRVIDQITNDDEG